MCLKEDNVYRVLFVNSCFVPGYELYRINIHQKFPSHLLSMEPSSFLLLGSSFLDGKVITCFLG
jgi:hypothetical protein